MANGEVLNSLGDLIGGANTTNEQLQAWLKITMITGIVTSVATGLLVVVTIAKNTNS